MFENIRSLIFKFDPETAHDLAIKALKTNIIPVKPKKYERLKTKFLNKEIINPIGIAAGFDKNAEVYNSLFKLGVPTKLPLTGATRSALESEPKVTYLSLISPQPLGSKPLHPKPGMKISVQA